MPTFTEYAIAAGHNNAAGLTLIGSIVPMGNIAFPEPTGAQHAYSTGIIKPRLDKILNVVGFNQHAWLMSGLTFAQYQYIQTTYCGGGVSGKVTITTRWYEDAFADYNATLQLQYENLQKTMVGFASVAMTFIDLVAI